MTTDANSDMFNYECLMFRGISGAFQPLRSTASVYIGTMVDSQNLDAVSVIVDRVEDPVRATSGTKEALELPLKRLAHATGCVRQVAEGELDDRGDDARRDALKVPPRRCCQNNFVAHGLRVGILNSARICSCV